SKSTWWAGVKAGRYPKPVKLGPRIAACHNRSRATSCSRRYLRLAGGLATTERKVCRNKSARRLSARFLMVTTEIGAGVSGSLPGKLRRKGYLSGTTEKSGTMVRKRPVASSLHRIDREAAVATAWGGSRPCVRNASAAKILPKLSAGGKTQGSFKRSA